MIRNLKIYIFGRSKKTGDKKVFDILIKNKRDKQKAIYYIDDKSITSHNGF